MPKTQTSTASAVEESGDSIQGELMGTASRLLMVSSTTLANVLIFGGLGYFLDGYFATKPWLLIAGMVVAFVATQVIVYRKVKRLIDGSVKK